jgi:hypothetical protein
VKKTGIAFMICFLFGAVAVSAEDEAIGEIKKLYAETAAAIARARNGEAGGLYCNELTVNSLNGSWRAVGNYLKKAVFWYSDQPEFAVASGMGAATVLAKVEVSELAAVRSLYREFLFEGGKLVFLFRSEKMSDGTAKEERIYFKDGRPLLHMRGQEKIPHAIDAKAIFGEAAYWQSLFLLIFGG